MRRSASLALVAVLLTLDMGVAAPTRAAPRSGAAAALPDFTATISVLDRETRALMIGSSWRPGCPVPLRDLRLLDLTYLDFDGRAHHGQLVVHRWYARGLVRVFRRLYAIRYPIRRMRLVDHYGADDTRSMVADNTSAFNCRWRAGSPGVWSQHAYGRAIDVNPVENPYVTSTHVSPPAGAAYVDRSQHLPGMIHVRDRVWWAFRAIGWAWGGTWTTVQDYQHFSANGR
jgi:poly-gamma-glutamate synthesis protein (capsule biosynthesis protein)